MLSRSSAAARGARSAKYDDAAVTAAAPRSTRRGSVAAPGDGHSLAQLLAPLPCIGGSDDVHAVAARGERAHQPLDECTCHVAFPARIGVRQAGDVQVLTNR